MSTDYGRDLWCDGEDIDPTGREVTGVLNVEQRLQRRLATRRGSLLSAPNDGIDLRDEVNDSLDSLIGFTQLAAKVKTECMRDEEVLTATVTGGFIAATRTLTLRIFGETAQGPFDLVLSIDKVSVTRIT